VSHALTSQEGSDRPRGGGGTSEFTVPHAPALVRVLLTQGVSRPGTIYLREHVAHHDGAETALDMLNRDEEFFPFRPADEEGVMLIAKAHTVTVSQDRHAPISDPARLSAARMVGVELVLAGGSTLGGWASYELPDGHARLLDYLNASGAPFFSIWTHATTYYVNRAHVLYARPLE
jgi:hypothetical protein